jgi:hypothetical protein
MTNTEVVQRELLLFKLHRLTKEHLMALILRHGKLLRNIIEGK